MQAIHSLVIEYWGPRQVQYTLNSEPRCTPVGPAPVNVYFAFLALALRRLEFEQLAVDLDSHDRVVGCGCHRIKRPRRPGFTLGAELRRDARDGTQVRIEFLELPLDLR